MENYFSFLYSIQLVQIFLDFHVFLSYFLDFWILFFNHFYFWSLRIPEIFFNTTKYFWIPILVIFGVLSSCLTSFLSFSKFYFSSPFPSILLIFVTLFIFLLYPTNLYISCIFYQFFGFLDPIPLHFIFLESQDYHLFITTTKYFWNPIFGILGCSF